MKLETINGWLRMIDLVLVVAFDLEEQRPTEIWLERASRYDERTREAD